MFLRPGVGETPLSGFAPAVTEAISPPVRLFSYTR
jgi:hypothetical protein